MTYWVVPLFLFSTLLFANVPPSDGPPKRQREFAPIEKRIKALKGMKVGVARRNTPTSFAS